MESILEKEGQKTNNMFAAEIISPEVIAQNARNTSKSLGVLYSRYVIAPTTERNEPRIIPEM
ncbi:hypothetical protein [Nitrosopumilus sp.]|uniref:hypothetical protein n=1 Tax=Nitrosopumilus sp. TaxID=2024843 RepID=UPI002626FE7F|nr:hypothetical protein [Nitrosopumilus sp.]